MAKLLSEISLLNWAAVILASVLYAIMNRGLLKGDVRQNLLTFILWCILDLVAGVSLYFSGGNYVLASFYVLGCLSVIACILTSGNWELEWSLNNKIVLAISAISIVGFLVSGPVFAAVWATVGVLVAGWPQIKDGWRSPQNQPVEIYFGFVAVNAFATIAGKNWSLPERLYPASCIALCFVTAAVPLIARHRDNLRAGAAAVRADWGLD